jgi:DNA mismatch repair protein MutS
VHLSAVEHQDSIVFLHAVQEGPASQSYGLQVAQLAGVPQPVIRAARRHLAMLEAQSATAAGQFDLFSKQSLIPEPEEAALVPAPASPVIDALEAIDPDSLSPREALEALYQLKRLADKTDLQR